MIGAESSEGSLRSTAPAMSSSPQLAGTTLPNPSAWQACASCTGVAGRTVRSASVPRMAIESDRGDVGG